METGQSNYLSTIRDLFTESWSKSAVNVAVFYGAGLVLQLLGVAVGIIALPIPLILTLNAFGTAVFVIASWLIYWRWPRDHSHGDIERTEHD
ncbi:MAG: hypothetical protein AAGI44_05270 [Pseudomonadota bacterium]